MKHDPYAHKISEAAQKELDTLLQKFENDFADTVKRISNLDIEVEPFSAATTGKGDAGEAFRTTLASLLNQRFRRRKTPLEREVNRVGGRIFNTVFSNLFGNDTRTGDFNPSAQQSMRLSQSQSAADIFSLLNRSSRNG